MISPFFSLNPFALLPLAAFIVNILLGILIFWKNPKDRLNIVFICIIFFLSIWSFAHFLELNADTSKKAFFYSRFSSAAASFVGILMLQFAILFSKKSIRKSENIILLYIPTIIFSFLAFSSNLISIGAEKTSFGWWIIRGPLYVVHSSYIFLCASLSVYLSFLCFKRAVLKTEKRHALVLVIGFLIPIIGGFFSEFVPPMINLHVFPLITTLTTATAVCIAYGILKYKFMVITSSIAAENIVEMMADLLIVVDPNHKIIFASHSITEILGYERTEIEGKPLTILCDNLNSACKPLIEKIKREHYLKNYEVKFETKWGATFWMTVNGSVISDSIGNIIGFVLIAHDMRETHDLIDRLKKKTHALEKSENDLLRQNAILEKLNEIAIKRELRIVELKEEIQKLKQEKRNE